MKSGSGAVNCVRRIFISTVICFLRCNSSSDRPLERLLAAACRPLLPSVKLERRLLAALLAEQNWVLGNIAHNFFYVCISFFFLNAKAELLKRSVIQKN